MRKRTPLRSKLVDFLLQRLDEQLHQQADLLLRAPPVLRTESEQGQIFDAALEAGAHRFTHHFDALGVAGKARHEALPCPATIAIHDDGDVTRHGLPLREPVSSNW
jgi:hypothetical protein